MTAFNVITDAAGLVKTKAFVVLNKGYTGSPELTKELQNFVKSRIAPQKYPRMIEFVDGLPKTVTGKIQRYKLRDC
jgi:acyl-coenzyme A synthetase/AMP-(fatty) acid ligase